MSKMKYIEAKYLGQFGTLRGFSDPRGVLNIDEKYQISGYQTEMYKTSVTLEGVKGVFNSLCFDLEIIEVEI